MTRRKDRLDGVRRVRGLQLDMARRDLAQAQQTAREGQAAHDARLAALQGLPEPTTFVGARGFGADRDHRIWMAAGVVAAAAQAELLLARLDLERLKLIEADRRVEGLRRFAEREQERARQEALADERRLVDDVVTSRRGDAPDGAR